MVRFLEQALNLSRARHTLDFAAAALSRERGFDMTENAASTATRPVGNGAGAPPMPTEETGSPLFAELVWAHYRYERERHKAKPGPELDALAKAYADKLAEFQGQVGMLDHVYWSTRGASAVAMTVKDENGHGARWLGHLGPAIVEHDQRVNLHRLSDWVTADAPRVADLLHECDMLAIRVGEVLRGTPERIAMRWILGVQEHLLGFVERTKHLKTADLDASEKALVKEQHAQLVAIERYYHRAASRAGRLVYITGMLMGLAPVAALMGLLGLVLGATGGWDRGAQLLILSAGAGAIGALVSAISRMGKPEKGKFNVDFELGRPLIRRLGLYRPFLGAIFGVALYFILRSGVAKVQLTPGDELYLLRPGGLPRRLQRAVRNGHDRNCRTAALGRRRQGRGQGGRLGRLAEQRADPLRVVRLAAEVRAPDHRPGADPEVVEAQGDERLDPALASGPVLEAVAERVPEERRHVVLAFGEVGLGVDRDEARTVAKNVVVVEVAVHDPVGPRAEFGEEVAGERDELAAFSFCAVEPAVDLGLDRPKRPSCRPPDACCDLDRDRRRLLVVET